MARLRIRIELSCGRMGVPLHKLAGVIGETQKFLHLVGDDVGLDRDKGEWLGFEFDRESLDFTAEYIGPVTAQQAQAFNAAFDGATSLRRGTIAQFAAIANAIGEDDVIGFGLYQSTQEEEPSEWRCLSRRDALRIADEIQVLLDASGELDQESYLPAVRDSGLESRMFGDRRERSQDHGKLATYVQKVEAALSSRITGVEKQVEEHSGLIHDLRSHSALTEESFRHLLAAIENFCGQATRQIETASPPPAPLPVRSGLPRWWLLAGASVVLAVITVLMSGLLRPRSSGWFEGQDTPVAEASSKRTEAISAPPAPVPEPTLPAMPDKPPPVAPEPRSSVAVKATVDLAATEPAWVSFLDAVGNKLFVGLVEPGQTRTVELSGEAVLRTGNAGGLVVHFNGKPIGPVGPTGHVSEVRFKDSAYQIVQITIPAPEVKSPEVK